MKKCRAASPIFTKPLVCRKRRFVAKVAILERTCCAAYQCASEEPTPGFGSLKVKAMTHAANPAVGWFRMVGEVNERMTCPATPAINPAVRARAMPLDILAR